MLQSYERIALISITAIVASIGDGLAEPIGVRFGKHKYNVKALFSEKIYSRSIEGSLCVFLTGVFSVIFMHDNLNSLEFFFALIIIPLALTLTEAFSPHTWDGPFIVLAGGASTVVVIELAKFFA